ncbi:MAG TPA: hypothetical protein VNU20_04500 [Candidatus Sulfotelmatobacter sp.]|nr:hypothetical protein [Candidatus Sulfotelmatobacter sp.]
MESNRDRQNLQEPNNFDGSRLDRLQVAAEWKHAAMNESILRRETKSGLGKSFLQIETREWDCWYVGKARVARKEVSSAPRQNYGFQFIEKTGDWLLQ